MKNVYTKEQLSEMSDHEVNLAVVNKIGFPLENMSGQAIRHIGGDEITGCNDFVGFTPCSNWNDVMPIAITNSIDIIIGICAVNDAEGYFAAINEGYTFKELGIIDSNKDNFCRAICEVFLMMDVK